MKMRRGTCSWRIGDLDEAEVARWFARDLLLDHVTPRRGDEAARCWAEAVSFSTVVAAAASKETREA
jgi:hypothetical protein